ncbi:MAG: tyrosine-type recombinase/integrase [Deltaproteobacteria bacterium]|nr:tyrosine-type recombinase/integrase [Deltaproteobacteria bacterium]MBW2025719.1 tyrosine-type recombinase/integrase [Deltaproteobacteria bacterium]MBW2124260.1 tyrosine-type recombinase/integrase [Deltaproteobacteria bacterium]
MSIYKDKNRGWWVSDFWHRKRRYRKAGFPTRNDALRWEAVKREELAAPKIQIPLISFQELATEYLKWCMLRMQPNTVRQKRFVYRSFLEFAGGDLPAEAVTRAQVGRLIQLRATQAGNKAANRTLRDLKALFNWAIDQELFFSPNPCRKIEPLPEEPYKPYVPPAEDIAKVRLVADRDERDFIETIYHTVCRRAEAARLTWEDINFERRSIVMYTRKRRGGQLEPIVKPMNRTLHDILLARYRRRDKSSPYVFNFSQDRLDHMMPRLCAKAGVKRFGFHAIRHFVSSIIADTEKGSLKAVQELLGHKRLATTEKYLHIIGKAVWDAVEVLDSGKSPRLFPTKLATAKSSGGELSD